MDDINNRTTEIIKIYKKLKQLNLGISGYEEFDNFRKISNQFIKDGKPVSGKIQILGTKRILVYDFNKKSVDCMLKYNSNI